MKVGVACIGGGGCGRAQAGALYHMHNHGLLDQVEVFAGTSVGGINLCAYAASLHAGRGAEGLKDVWQAIKKTTDIYTPPLPPTMGAFLDPRWSYAGALGRYFFGPGFADISGLVNRCKAVLGQTTAEDVRRKTGKVFVTRGLNYGTNEIESLGCSLPLLDMALGTGLPEGIFPGHAIGKSLYGDGGVADNAPADVLIQAGCTHCYLVYCKPDTSSQGLTSHDFDPGRPKGFQLTLRGLDKALSINEELVWAWCQEHPEVQWIHVIPGMDTGNFLDFSERGLWQHGEDVMGQFAVTTAEMMGYPTGPAIK